MIQKEDCCRFWILAIVVKSSILSRSMTKSLTKKSDPFRVFVKSSGITRSSKVSGSIGRLELLVRLIDCWSASWDGRYGRCIVWELPVVTVWIICAGGSLVSLPLSFKALIVLITLDLLASAAWLWSETLLRWCCPSINVVTAWPLHCSISRFSQRQ